MSRAERLIAICESTPPEGLKVGDWIFVHPDYSDVRDRKRKYKILAFRSDNEEVQLNDPEMMWYPISAVSKGMF